MSCDLKEYIEGLRCQLKDPDDVRWKHLTWIISIAARQIQQDRKDLFKEDKRIKLEIGCYTNVCIQGCEEITAPFRMVGDECDDIIDIPTNSDWISSFFPDMTCNPFDAEQTYKVSRIETDIEDPCTIKVDPPVPDDGNAYWIIAKCQKDIDEMLSNGQLPAAICQHKNAFTQLVLFYAYSMDSMVNADHTQAAAYFDRYLQLMELTYLNDLSIREKTLYLRDLIDRSKRQGS